MTANLCSATYPSRFRTGFFLDFTGPPGGANTTLLRLMLGLLSPSSGSLRIFGDAPQSMRPSIGYVPQFPTIRRDFPASVLDLVLMGAARPGLRGGWWPTNAKGKDKARDLLETLGLAHLARQPLTSLSGGETQRAMVARALMSAPEAEDAPFLLLLDEPTASIDPQGKFCFYEFLEKLRGTVTIVVVSHDFLLASPFFSRIAFVNRTLNMLPDNRLTPEVLTALFGAHMHTCPVGDLQHAAGLHHQVGCTHTACRTQKEPWKVL